MKHRDTTCPSCGKLIESAHVCISADDTLWCPFEQKWIDKSLLFTGYESVGSDDALSKRISGFESHMPRL